MGPVKANDGKCPFEGFFLVLGDARSGTTFLVNELMRCEAVVVPPESQFMARVIKDFPKDMVTDRNERDRLIDIVFSDVKFADWGLTRSELVGRLGSPPFSVGKGIQNICALYAEKTGRRAGMFGIKKNVIFYFHQIVRWFPKLRVVWVLRDGRAVYASKKRSVMSHSGRPFATNPVGAALEWVERNRELGRIRSVFGRTICVRYEDMLKRPEEVIDRVCRFLGVSYVSRDHGPDQSYRIPNRYGKFLHQNVGKEPIVNRIWSWKEELSSSEVRAYELIAWQELVRHGYGLTENQGKLWRCGGLVFQRAYELSRFLTRKVKMGCRKLAVGVHG
jgi:hypothetical protein